MLMPSPLYCRSTAIQRARHPHLDRRPVPDSRCCGLTLQAQSREQACIQHQALLQDRMIDVGRQGGIRGLGQDFPAVDLNGLARTPTAPASMEVQVAPGEIYSLQNLDESAYSSLPADIDHPILKQGLMLDAGLFACSAPATSGHSIDYLVQAAYLDVDAEPAVLPYYDTNHPDHPYSGPN